MTNLNINQDKAQLYQKIARVMGKVERVPKNGYNNFHKYQFVQESDLVDHARKIMVEEGLVLFNSVREYEINGDIAIGTVEFTLCCIDTGESITTVMVAEGQDKGDKKFPKLMASATKYYLMKTFLIPTGDDPEREAPQQGGYSNQQPYQQNQAPQFQNIQSSADVPKDIKPDQVKLIEQRIKEVLTLVDDPEEGTIMEKLRTKVGEFEAINKMTYAQARKSIDYLNAWKVHYEGTVTQ